MTYRIPWLSSTAIREFDSTKMRRLRTKYSSSNWARIYLIAMLELVERVSAIREPLTGLDIAMYSQLSSSALLAKRSTYAKPTFWPLYTQLIRVRTGSAIRTDADSTPTNEETITSWIPRRRWRSSPISWLSAGRRHQWDPALICPEWPYDPAAFGFSPVIYLNIFQFTNYFIIYNFMGTLQRLQFYFGWLSQ